VLIVSVMRGVSDNPFAPGRYPPGYLSPPDLDSGAIPVAQRDGYSPAGRSPGSRGVASGDSGLTTDPGITDQGISRR
jgi:hypothetical protein